MMEALAAIGLVGNVLQLIEFIAKLVSKSSDIRRNVATIEYDDIETASSELVRLRGEIACPRIGRSTTAAVMTNEDNSFKDLVSKCSDLSEEVLSYLKLLKGKPSTSVWKSLRQALKSITGKRKLDEMCTRLARLQDALQSHILVNLKLNVEVQATIQQDRHQEFLSAHQNIVRLLSDSQDVTEKTISTHTQAIMQMSDESDRKWGVRFQQTMAAIEGLPARINFKQNLAALEHMRVADPAHASRLVSLERSNEDYTSQEIARAKAAVLDGLRYRQMKLRERGIGTAHQSTFQWVFEYERSESWDDFTQWLRYGTGCYWINGKAASGKSTLMKHIVGHSVTSTALHYWAQGSYLLILSFFFWNSGTFLQRSQEGLYRAILYEVLAKHDDLIEKVFPELYSEEIKQVKRQTSVQPLSKIELKVAFMKLLEALPASGRVYLFVDGLDEYEGDHAEICELFHSVVSQPNVKAVLSSRPIPACVGAFKYCKGLRLEHLTKTDISHYVSETLGSQPRMQELELYNPQEAQELKDHIVARASGVFLWVILVVKSLIDGLRNHDRISDLRKMLDRLPGELEDLYMHMLSKMSPLYRSQASAILQIALCHFLMEVDEPLTLLQLSFAEDEDPLSSVKLADTGLTTRQLHFRIRGIHGRLLSRCCGLLEVPGAVTHDASVSFLHKSVADFLRGPDIGAFLLALTCDSDFDVNVALVSSKLALLKIFRKDWQWHGEVILDNDKTIPLLLRQVHTFFNFCELVDTSSDQCIVPYIEECDRVMARGWSHVRYVEKVKPRLENHRHWAVVMSVAFPGDQYQFVDSLISLAVTHSLSGFIRNSVKGDMAVVDVDIASELLLRVMEGICWNVPGQEMITRTTNACQIAESLILRGADVNYKRGATLGIWDLAFLHFDQAIDQAIEGRDNDDLFPDWQLQACRLLLLFLKHGGDSRSSIKRKGVCRYSGRLLFDERSTYNVVERAYSIFLTFRRAGVQMLLPMVTVLLDQLRETGAENFLSKDGRRVQSLIPMDYIFADTEIISCPSSSSLLKPDPPLENIFSREAPIPTFEPHPYQQEAVPDHNLIHLPPSHLRMAETFALTDSRLADDTRLARQKRKRGRYEEEMGHLSQSTSATDPSLSPPPELVPRRPFTRHGTSTTSSAMEFCETMVDSPQAKYTTNGGGWDIRDAWKPLSAARRSRYPKGRICQHRQLAKICPLGCGRIFNPPPDGF